MTEAFQAFIQKLTTLNDDNLLKVEEYVNELYDEQNSPAEEYLDDEQDDKQDEQDEDWEDEPINVEPPKRKSRQTQNIEEGTVPARKAKIKLKKVNLFDTMEISGGLLKDSCQEDIVKKIDRRVPPRKPNLVSVSCCKCGTRHKVSPLLLDSERRFKCNSCIGR